MAGGQGFGVRAAALLLALLAAALLAGGCSSFQRDPPGDPSAPYSPYAKQKPPDYGPGCYDHRGNIDRTITTAAECAVLAWVWRS